MKDRGVGALADRIHEYAVPLAGTSRDYNPLLEGIGDADFVLLGEATHGTHEFYRERARITKRLIEEKGFTLLAIEADWPDAYRVNRYVHRTGADANGREALAGFQRFPTWMWRNTEMLDFVEWLRRHNASVPERKRVGLYGLDLYSLHTSMAEVLRYLDTVDPEAAQRARYRYACFDHYGEDTQAYGYAAGVGLTSSCEDQVVRQLTDLHARAADYARRDGFVAEDEFFYAEQNARLVKNAERYYRTMFQGHVSSWNLRDRHMAETLDALVAHFTRRMPHLKAIVWEHNSHIGDARATRMGEQGELNIGQLVRERYGRRARLIGFSTYSGTVTAASEWGGPAEHKVVKPALPDSYEALFHHIGVANFMLSWPEDSPTASLLGEPRLERAIGVIYLPQTERMSHYFSARLSQQFDAILHFDQTSAVVPLDHPTEGMPAEAPETFPSGM